MRERPGAVLPIAMEAHTRIRAAIGLPEKPPKDPQRIPCKICVNECRIPENGFGYCGLGGNEGGKLASVSPDEGKLS
jgi:pyruvate formate lyase activating enzyme